MRKGAIAGSITSEGYGSIVIDGHTCVSHRVVWLMTYGEWPTLGIDHINRNRIDNRPSNLRLATNSQQLGNTKLSKRNTHGAKGLYYRKGAPNPWGATIGMGSAGKKKHIGCFSSKEEAIAARNEVALKYFGEFANEPNMATSEPEAQ